MEDDGTADLERQLLVGVIYDLEQLLPCNDT